MESEITTTACVLGGLVLGDFLVFSAVTRTLELGYARATPTSAVARDYNCDGKPDFAVKSRDGTETIFYSFRDGYKTQGQIREIINQEAREEHQSALEKEMLQYQPRLSRWNNPGWYETRKKGTNAERFERWKEKQEGGLK
ncbi:MAG: hypothetical protein ABIB79_04460 [archaeon]